MMKAFKARIVGIINETSCSHCEFDEASGAVFKHCDKCCRRIVVAISLLCLEHFPLLDDDQ